ncbi:MAG: hypothetical protein GY928_31985 [Colwellia sp.]|nr:hypothetical protein [Colwellia sp.]
MNVEQAMNHFTIGVCVKSNQCEVCKNPVEGRKTCSDECYRELQSILATAARKERYWSTKPGGEL